jgi:hypothetical protein
MLFNYDHPELVFSMASFLLNLGDDYQNEFFDCIPVRASNLTEDFSEITKRLDEELEEMSGEKYFEDDEVIDLKSVKFALFGIYPKTDLDQRAIASFFDNNLERIMLWLDWHPWPKNLTSFVNIPKKTFFNEIKTCLEVLNDEGYIFPSPWHKAEKAMLSNDFNNPVSARYWRAFLVSKSTGFNYMAKRGADFLLFNSIVDELIDDRESSLVSDFEKDFDAMEIEVEEMVAKISDDHPLFAVAKQIGRPVGCLFLGEVQEYFNVSDILQLGVKKFPWLCFISYTFDGQMYAYFESKKFPFKGITRNSILSIKDFSCQDELLVAIKNEIIRFKEKD